MTRSRTKKLPLLALVKFKGEAEHIIVNTNTVDISEENKLKVLHGQRCSVTVQYEGEDFQAEVVGVSG